MSGKKVEDKYKKTSENTKGRSHTSEGSDRDRNRQNSVDKYLSQRKYDDRSSTRYKGRAGCLFAIGLFILVIAALYIIIFESPWLGKDREENSEQPSVETIVIESTPTPTPKPEATAVPTPTLVPMSTIGYINTVDEDGTVRFREEPNRNGARLDELTNREVVHLMGKENGYYKVKYKNEIGYIYEDYIVEHLPEDHMICDVVTHELSYSNLVDLTVIIPSLIIEMPYATQSNHVNQQMYPFELALLQEDTAYKLKAAQEMFLEDGYSLVIWDAYRPYSVTAQTFEIIGDPALAADPSRGSRHNKGAAIDVTLYDLKKDEYVDMPTEVREMDLDLSRRLSPHMTLEQRANMEYMEDVLGKAGFSPYRNEWWHYNDMDALDAPVMDILFEAWENQ